MSRRGWLRPAAEDTDPAGGLPPSSGPPVPSPNAAPPAPATPSGAPGEEPDPTALLERLVAGQERLEKLVQESAGNAGILRLVTMQTAEATRQALASVAAQSQQGAAAVVDELRRMQSAGAQRALSGIVSKLMRDLVQTMNQLDETVALASKAEPAGAAATTSGWVASLRATRDRFEATLRDWGCLPIEVRVGTDAFDPEIHEAAPMSGSGGTNRVVAVERRGWTFGGAILQHPRVVVD